MKSLYKCQCPVCNVSMVVFNYHAGYSAGVCPAGHLVKWAVSETALTAPKALGWESTEGRILVEFLSREMGLAKPRTREKMDRAFRGRIVPS